MSQEQSAWSKADENLLLSLRIDHFEMNWECLQAVFNKSSSKRRSRDALHSKFKRMKRTLNKKGGIKARMQSDREYKGRDKQQQQVSKIENYVIYV